MAKIDQLYQQHREILATATALSRQLDAAALPSNALAARRALSKLVSDLVAHLAVEDSYVYPKLANHAKAAVQQLARRFVDEMGGLRDAVHAHNRRWLKATAIAERPGAFVRETAELLLALQDRIDKEDNELYPLLKD